MKNEERKMKKDKKANRYLLMLFSFLIILFSLTCTMEGSIESLRPKLQKDIVLPVLEILQEDIFFIAEIGYTEIEPETITLTNISEEKANIASIEIDNEDAFVLLNTDIELIEASGSAEFAVQPNIGLGRGTYSTTITVTYDNDQIITVNARLVVLLANEPYLIASPVSVIFDKVDYGYEQPEEKIITIINKGYGTANISKIEIDGKDKDIFVLNENITSIAAGDTADFTIQPITGLDLDVYNAEINVYYDNDEILEIAAVFIVLSPNLPYLLISPLSILYNADYGYTQPLPTIITINNIGSADANITSLIIGGDNTDCFTLEGNENITTVEAESIKEFTVRPNAGLDAGTYSAQITIIYIKGQDSITTVIDISFTVNKKEYPVLDPPEVESKDYNIVTLKTVVSATGQDVVYAINNSATIPSSGWQNSPEFKSLTGGNTHYFFVRVLGNNNYFEKTSVGTKVFIPISISVMYNYDWTDALTTIKNGGNDKEYILNISAGGRWSMPTDTINIPGNQNFGSVTGLIVLLRGIGTLKLSSSGSILSVGYSQTLIIENPTLTLQGFSNNSSATLTVNNGGTLELKSGNITNNSNNGVRINNGTFNMSGGEISGNSFSGNGGGVSMVSGVFNMSGGEIKNNTVSGLSSRGGGVHISDGGILVMTGDSVIYGNDNNTLKNTAITGAAVYIQNGKITYNNQLYDYTMNSWSSSNTIYGTAP